MNKGFRIIALWAALVLLITGFSCNAESQEPTYVSRTMSDFVVKTTRIAILNTSGEFRYNYTATNNGWITMHTNVKKIALGS